MARLKPKILIADDDRASRSVLREMLSPEGYEIVEAQDGKEALAYLEKEAVDLLITDRAMSHLGGLELLSALAEQKKPIPSLVISAYGEEELWGKAIGRGASDYLLKPFKHEEVLKAVRKILNRGKTS